MKVIIIPPPSDHATFQENQTTRTEFVMKKQYRNLVQEKKYVPVVLLAKRETFNQQFQLQPGHQIRFEKL